MGVLPNSRVVVGPINADQTDGTFAKNDRNQAFQFFVEEMGIPEKILPQMYKCSAVCGQKKPQESVPLTLRHRAIPRQRHILGVLPRHSLNRRVQPERLSDAHGGERKVGQILPAHTCIYSHLNIQP